MLSTALSLYISIVDMATVIAPDQVVAKLRGWHYLRCAFAFEWHLLKLVPHSRSVTYRGKISWVQFFAEMLFPCMVFIFAVTCRSAKTAKICIHEISRYIIYGRLQRRCGPLMTVIIACNMGHLQVYNEYETPMIHTYIPIYISIYCKLVFVVNLTLV